MGAGTAVHESSFMKRMLAVSQYPGSSTSAVPNVTAPTILQSSMTNIGAYDDREIYKPCSDANFTTCTVTFDMTGIVTGVNTLFLSGMPQASNPTGGGLTPGDILVVDGVPYNIVFRAAQTNLQTYVCCCHCTIKKLVCSPRRHDSRESIIQHCLRIVATYRHL